jgi:transposase, IS5 family
MRIAKEMQMKLGEVDISQVKIDPKSRDDIPQILRGIQYLYTDEGIREKLFYALEKTIPATIDKTTGRPGMELWKIFVLGILRLNLNCDYDRLQSLANNYKTVREMLGHGMMDEDYYYQLQTLKDNVRLLTPEVLAEINQIIVGAGHKLLKKKETAKLAARCDSFVVKTNVHFPTDINLLFDALRKAIQLTSQLCDKFDITTWRQYQYNIKTVKKAYRNAQQSKRANSRNEYKRLNQIQETHRIYIELAENFLTKVKQTTDYINKNETLTIIQIAKLMEIEEYVVHGVRQIDQIKSRVLDGEVIPNNEKVFSLFEPHTGWICKGKLGVPVELGVRVCIVEDKNQFILHHKVMWKQTDEKLTVPMAEETKNKFPNLYSVSYDRGFYSKHNRDQLGEILNSCSLPKKGKLSETDKLIQSSEEFKKAKEKHSAVESAINALGVHGLDRCPDHGKVGFERYVALAIVARNTQLIGAILQKREQRLMILRERRQKLKAA